ncbi:MAG: response regulator [Gemmatimonadaceae bacterium]|nr:response regulator [Gemmatimonadaceae bacterium]
MLACATHEVQGTVVAADTLAERLRAIFVEELAEQVQQLNDALLALERAPADAEAQRSVFRVMHTLKGAARAASVPEVESLCHLLEADLARAREVSSPVGGATIALLFAAADALADAGLRLAAGTPLSGGPLDTVLQQARGRRVIAPTAPAVQAAPPPATPPVDAVSAVSAPVDPVPAPSADVAPDAVSSPSGNEPEAPLARAAAEGPRDELVRVGLHHVDAISNAAGEVTSLAGALTDRTGDLAMLRQRVRRQRERPDRRDDDALADIDREITRLLGCVGEDARTLGSVSGRLTATARRLRQRSLRELTETLPRVVRDIAHDVGKQATLVITGEEVEADRVVIEALREPLLHLVRNAVDHGIESADARQAAGKPAQGTIEVTASLRGDRLRVAISDDGRGLDLVALRRALQQRGREAPADRAALQRTIFDDGLSTRERATTLSGRGVGLGIVRVAVERVGGTVEVESSEGRGTTFVLEVPLSIATLRALTVTVDRTTFGIPSAFVSRVDRIHARRIARVDGRAMLPTGGAPTPVATLAALLGPPFAGPPVDDMLPLVTIEMGGRRMALIVDGMDDERELVLRPLEHAGDAATALTVATALLGDGEVVLLLGVAALLGEEAPHAALPLPAHDRFDPATRRILVVDDSITSRTLEQSVLSAAGYDVVTAVDGLEGWRMVERGDIALVISDVEMPHLDGIGLCERIRASQHTASLPVILVTSLDAPQERARGLEAGADAYVTKSGFDQDTLLDTVRQLLGAPPVAT